jgi:hypothetical protein
MFVDVVGDITASDQSETVMCHELAEALGELWRTLGHAFDSYRPELYYMRGPGPKRRAKHLGIVAAARRKLPNRAPVFRADSLPCGQCDGAAHP